MKTHWVNIYWDMNAVEECNFLEQNVIFLGDTCLSEEEAHKVAIQQDCEVLKHISVIEVPEKVLVQMHWLKKEK